MTPEPGRGAGCDVMGRYNQSDFGIDHLVMSCGELSLGVLEKYVFYDQHVLLTKLC